MQFYAFSAAKKEGRVAVAPFLTTNKQTNKAMRQKNKQTKSKKEGSVDWFGSLLITTNKAIKRKKQTNKAISHTNKQTNLGEE